MLEHQNNNQNLSFMRNINVVAKKITRNGLKIANSLGCAFRFESDFTFGSEKIVLTKFRVNQVM